MKRPPLSKCLCGKLSCPSVEDAREIRAKIWAREGGATIVRFYECPSGATHWTRQTDPNYHLKAVA